MPSQTSTRNSACRDGPDPARVFLDNNIWNALAKAEGPLTVDALVAAFERGDIEIVGTVELFEEIVGTAVRRRTRYRRMKRLWRKLCGKRVLLPINERHRLEVERGGLLSDAERYLPPSVQQAVATRASRDSAYGSGETRVALTKRRHRLAIKPWPTADTGRYTRDDFTVDHQAQTATCPAGHTVTLTAANNAIFERHCTGCPLRSRCTTAQDGRTLRLNDHDAELVEARRAWRDGDFADDYRRWRPMVERSLAWLVRPGRRVTYRGLARNRIWLAHRAAAVNLQRLINLGLTNHNGWQLAT